NEAAAITPRKIDPAVYRRQRFEQASMRPRQLRRGRLPPACAPIASAACFNEAAAITPRKMGMDTTPGTRGQRFNEAAAITPRKMTASGGRSPPLEWLQ